MVNDAVDGWYSKLYGQGPGGRLVQAAQPGRRSDVALSTPDRTRDRNCGLGLENTNVWSPASRSAARFTIKISYDNLMIVLR